MTVDMSFQIKKCQVEREDEREVGHVGVLNNQNSKVEGLENRHRYVT